MSSTSVQAGNWCSACLDKEREEAWLPLLQALARRRGGKCLSDAYVDSRTKLRWQCRQGHEWRRRPLRADRISDKSLSVQAGAPWVARLLSAWRNTIRSEELTYAPARWQGPTLLPPDATIQAYRQLRDASDMGLTSLEDQLVFSLHRLYMHPRLETHLQVRAAIARAAAGETSLAAQFDNYSDAMWAQIVATLP